MSTRPIPCFREAHPEHSRNLKRNQLHLETIKTLIPLDLASNNQSPTSYLLDHDLIAFSAKVQSRCDGQGGGSERVNVDGKKVEISNRTNFSLSRRPNTSLGVRETSEFDIRKRTESEDREFLVSIDPINR